MTTLAQAIANLEGYGVAGAIPTVANNPGNLELGDIGYGTLQAAGGNQITIFPSEADGWSALNNEIGKIYNGTSKYYSPSTSLQDFGSTYSGGNSAYGAHLANQLGVPPNTPLGNLQNPTITGKQSSSGTGFNPLDPSTYGGAVGASQANTLTGKILGWLYGDSGKPQNPVSFLARLSLFIIGLILITAGVFSFKTTQDLIAKGVHAGKKGAALLSP